MFSAVEIEKGQALLDETGAIEWLRGNAVFDQGGCIDIVPTLEKHGVEVYYRKFYGAGILLSNDVMVVNENQDLGERLLTIGHEFGHFVFRKLTGHPKPPAQYDSLGYHEFEAACELLGMHFLTPVDTWDYLI